MAFRFHTGTSGIASDFVVVDDSALDNIFDGGGTVMLWVYADTYGMASFGRLFDKSGVSILGWRAFVDDVGNVDRIGFIQEFSGGNGEWVSATGSFSAGAWHHVAITYNASSAGNDPIYYVDGVLSATTQVLGPSGTRESDVGARFLIGARFAYDRAFDGRLADARAYDEILSAARIQSICTARGADSDITGILVRYPMSPHRDGRGVVNPWIDDTEQTANASSISVSVPDEIDGDLLVMTVFSCGNSSGTAPNITTPSGWTQRVHQDAPSAVSRPVLAVYTRAASSEPASYAVSQNQTCPIIGFMTSYRGVTTTPQDVATNTGTDNDPVSPSVTPGSNALVYRVAGHDEVFDQPTPRGNYFPSNIRGRRVLGLDGPSGNGGSAGIGEEVLDGAASGTRMWGPIDSNDEWVTATLSFLFGDGIEGLPAKDFAHPRKYGETWHQVIGAEDTLKVGGC